MLSSRVSVPLPPEHTQEDIFSSSISSLFTDDTQNSHGTPGQAVVYHSPRYGEITLGIPQHPDVEEGRKLFAHYLWNSGVVAADAIECASHEDVEIVTASEQMTETNIWDRRYWNVKGKDVLELGAGTALPSIISAKCAARSTTITDHVSSPAITTNTIFRNIRENLGDTSSAGGVGDTATTNTQITIAGLTWGDPFFTSPNHHGKLLSPQPTQHSFDRMIIADCLWMPSQHENLVKTIDHWLRHDSAPSHATNAAADKDTDISRPCALVIAGFHTGRSTVASFFEIATGANFAAETKQDSNQHTQLNHQGGKNMNEDRDGCLSIAQIFEVDVDLNVREWVNEREGENKEQLKKWCVCAVLVRGEPGKHGE